MTVINREPLFIEDLLAEKDSLLKISGNFLGIAMTPDPELSIIWNPLEEEKHKNALRSILSIASSLDTFGKTYQIYAQYRDTDHRISLTVTCPYDRDYSSGFNRSYTRSVLDSYRALCYMQIVKDYLTLDPDTRRFIPDQVFVDAKRMAGII